MNDFLKWWNLQHHTVIDALLDSGKNLDYFLEKECEISLLRIRNPDDCLHYFWRWNVRVRTDACNVKIIEIEVDDISSELLNEWAQ